MSGNKSGALLLTIFELSNGRSNLAFTIWRGLSLSGSGMDLNRWVTSELLDGIELLLSEDIDAETLRERDPRKLILALHGAP